MNSKDIFFKHQAQTSPSPFGIEVRNAKGSTIYDKNGKSYLDFIAGVSVNPLGHCHPKISKAIKKQLNQYSHVMVYGEFIQDPQAALCKLLSDLLPENLNAIYLVNSGTEATEGALKLAKRSTKRMQIIAARNSYHGNTQGSMSVCGVERQNRAFRPLIPGVTFINFNEKKDLVHITEDTAAVILETIQGGAGFISPEGDYLKKVRERCTQVKALLILDEMQCGIWRTGKFSAFENYDCKPDILIIGKALGGGMPIGAFISDAKHMEKLKKDPVLGHITTFGGHPVVCAAAVATLKEILSSQLMNEIQKKENLIRNCLKHECITEIKGKGLMLALMMKNETMAYRLVKEALKEGLLLFFLLFEKRAVRITPPLNISDRELRKGCAIILSILEKFI